MLLSILKQIVWETGYGINSTPNSSWVIYHNNILHKWSISQEPNTQLKFIPFLSFSDNLLKDKIFQKSMEFWESAQTWQNMHNFGLACCFPLYVLKSLTQFKNTVAIYFAMRNL